MVYMKEFTKDDLLAAMDVFEKYSVPKSKHLIITQYWAIKTGLVRRSHLSKGQRYQYNRNKRTYRVGDYIIVPNNSIKFRL
jgi:hypothetical protein